MTGQLSIDFEAPARAARAARGDAWIHDLDEGERYRTVISSDPGKVHVKVGGDWSGVTPFRVWRVTDPTEAPAPRAGGSIHLRTAPGSTGTACGASPTGLDVGPIYGCTRAGVRWITCHTCRDIAAAALEAAP